MTPVETTITVLALGIGLGFLLVALCAAWR